MPNGLKYTLAEIHRNLMLLYTQAIHIEDEGQRRKMIKIVDELQDELVPRLKTFLVK